MKAAVTYMRMSTDRQEHSIDSQERLIKSYANQNNFAILHNYIDEGISGRNAEKRPQFLQMIDDSAKGEFQYVIIYDSSRFARNLEQSLVYKSILKKNGVELVSITEPVLDEDTSLITDALFGQFPSRRRTSGYSLYKPDFESCILSVCAPMSRRILS